MSVRDTSIDPRLLQSAREEFLKHGFLKADLKTICEKAGITTGAVYKRYKGKEDLFCAVVRDAVDVLDGFVSESTEMDFSGMSDDEIRSRWFMDEKELIDLFKILWSVREDIVLLLEKSSGTVYENYGHDFALRMTDSYLQYYTESKKRGVIKADMTKAEIQVLCASFWVSIYEPFIHRMSWKKIEEHCRYMCRFYDWVRVMQID